MSTINQKEIINDTIEDNNKWEEIINYYPPYYPLIPCSTTSNC